MQRADEGKEQKRTRQQIGPKEQEIEEQTHKQHLFTWKTINDKATERTDKQGGERITRQHQSDNIFRGIEILAQIKRQQGRKQIKGKRHGEVRCHHLPIVGIPKPVSLFFHS